MSESPKILRKAALAAFILISIGYFYQANEAYRSPEKNERTLVVPKNFRFDVHENGLRVAVLGDLHVKDSKVAYQRLSKLVNTVIESNPDLILLLGDYTSGPESVSDMQSHRSEIASRLMPLTTRPVLAVLGNYETWSSSSQWRKSFFEAGIEVLQNDVKTIRVNDRYLCIRGLGDTYTEQFRYTRFSVECEELSRITITHDPAGAFQSGVQGIVFAAHTHCGQIRLPLIGSLWVPSDAPEEATCGLYTDEVRLLWVTSGVGSSILPIRLGAQSQWDLLTIKSSHAKQSSPSPPSSLTISH